MKSITNTMPARIKTTQEMAPGGGAVRLGLPFAGLNFAITAMVTPGFEGLERSGRRGVSDGLKTAGVSF